MNLVTGATGLVGSHLLLDLLLRGEQVAGLCRENSDKTIVEKIFEHYGHKDLYGQVIWRTGDINDLESLRAVMTDVDTVYHTAAMVSFEKKSHERMWATNVNGTINIIETIVEGGCKTKLCVTSSIGALGHTPDGSLIDEQTPYQSDSNRTAYSLSKFRQEMEVWRGIEKGLKAVIVNPGVILGPCVGTRSCGQIAQTMQHGTKYYTEGATGYVDVRDVAKAMIELTEKNMFGERYILVGENSSVKHIEDLMADAFCQKRPTRFASKVELHIAAAALRVKSWLTGCAPALTRESVRAMGGCRQYSSQKIIDTIGINFISLEDSVKNMTDFHKNYNDKAQ